MWFPHKILPVMVFPFHNFTRIDNHRNQMAIEIGPDFGLWWDGCQIESTKQIEDENDEKTEKLEWGNSISLLSLRYTRCMKISIKLNHKFIWMSKVLGMNVAYKCFTFICALWGFEDLEFSQHRTNFMCTVYTQYKCQSVTPTMIWIMYLLETLSN